MTKLLALCLVFSALFTASHCMESKDDVIVKDGHRIVVVEYDGDGKTNTRVLISPPEEEEKRRDREGEVFVIAKKRVKETASSLPLEEERDLTPETPRETVSRAARDVKETMTHEAQYAEEKVSKAKEAVNERAMKKAHKVQNVWEKTKIPARRIGTAVSVELTKIGSVVGLLGIGAAYGMCVWVTFVSSYLLASVLGRQQSGVLQSKVYPVYFKAISAGILIGLLGHVISRRLKVLTDAVEMWQTVNLLASILMVEANASFVEPRATKAMFERIKAEKEDRRGVDTSVSESIEAVARTGGEKVTRNVDEVAAKQRLTKLSERLSKLKAYSSRLNLLTLMTLTWHFVYLGHRLSLTC